MSPRAACRLETLGFARVYDYVLGKADWLAHGLPTEGEQADLPRAKDLLSDDVVTARLDEPVGAVRERVARSPNRSPSSSPRTARCWAGSARPPWRVTLMWPSKT